MEIEINKNDPYCFYVEAAKKLPPTKLRGDALNRSLVARIQAGDKSAESELVVRNFRLVILVVKQHVKKNIPDAVQAWFIGLIDAAPTFDFERGTKFTTHATYRILNAIRHERRNGKYIVVPEEVEKLQNTFKKLTQSFVQTVGRYPTNEEALKILTAYKLRKRLKKREPTEEEIQKSSKNFKELVFILNGLQKRPVCLDEPVHENDQNSKSKSSFFADRHA